MTRRQWSEEWTRTLLSCWTRLPRADRTAVAIDPVPTSRWLTTWQDSLGLGDRGVAAAVELFARLDRPVAYAAVDADEGPSGVALGVLDGEWLGIFNMATLP